jgi:hypothetical protein
MNEEQNSSPAKEPTPYQKVREAKNAKRQKLRKGPKTLAKDYKTYRDHRGAQALTNKVYQKDLASVLKLRYEDHMTYDQISKLTGLSPYMITEMAEPFQAIMANPEGVKRFKKYEPDMLDGIRMLMVEGMFDQLSDPKRRKTLDLSRLTYGYGVLYDKARLERGESTANVKTLSDLVRAAHAKEIVEEAEVVEVVA